MKFAYADPPYLGCGKLYADQHPDALAWDKPERHQQLVEQLCTEYPDGWAMSLSSPSYDVIKPMCPPDCRTGIWVKPFAFWKPNVNPAYAWEPVIFRGGRRHQRYDDCVRDWIAENVLLQTGMVGTKPRGFCRWVFAFLNAQSGDTLDDLFPGSGAVTAAWIEWVGDNLPTSDLPLFETIGGA